MQAECFLLRLTTELLVAAQNLEKVQHFQPIERTETLTKSPLPPTPQITKSDLEIKLTPSDKAILKKLDMEHREKLKAAKESDKALKEESGKSSDAPKVKAVPNPKSKQFVRENSFCRR